MTESNHKHLSYSIHLKLYAVQLHLDEGYNYDSIVKQLKLPNEEHIKEWVDLYKNYGLDGLKLLKHPAESQEGFE